MNNSSPPQVPEIMNQALSLVERLQPYQKATMAGMFGLMTSLGATSEAAYRELYEDILGHQAEWFDIIFASDDNYVKAERTCGILGTLAMIKRRRGELTEAASVLTIYTRVLDVYRGMCDRCTVQEQKHCCKVLTYKHDLVASNTYTELNDKDKAVLFFRRAVEYELRNQISFEEQNKAFILGCLGMEKYLSLTVKKFREITDDTCWRAILHVAAVDRGEITWQLLPNV